MNKEFLALSRLVAHIAVNQLAIMTYISGPKNDPGMDELLDKRYEATMEEVDRFLREVWSE